MTTNEFANGSKIEAKITWVVFVLAIIATAPLWVTWIALYEAQQKLKRIRA